MRIVMTGGSSGIGLEAAKILRDQGHELVLGGRSASPAYTVVPLDLADLESVRGFAAAVGTAPIDALIGNAGLQVTAPQRSAQGYELTFAVNHLAHYLLVRLLLPSLARDGRIILTSSGTHDPAQRTGMPPPRHADAPRLAHPDQDGEWTAKPGTAGRRAYSTSKLCNLMTIRELARRTADHPDLALIAFDPAFVPGTGLARNYPAPLRWMFRHVVPIVVRGAHVSTPRRSGAALAEVATANDYAGQRAEYWAVSAGRLTRQTPSALARDDAACAALWRDSAALVGLAD